MQLSNLKPSPRLRRHKRIGRGGKRGTFSGRGTKGQKARAGRRIRPAVRDIIKKIPKRRGYSQKQLPFRRAAVNLKELEAVFEAGALVAPNTLLEKNLVRRVFGKAPQIKILGTGSLSKGLRFKGVLFSKSAREAIEKSGGKIEG
ncbi:MAG: uL15 family ribosomal protein [Patescibacteria group bacterium]